MLCDSFWVVKAKFEVLELHFHSLVGQYHSLVELKEHPHEKQYESIDLASYNVIHKRHIQLHNSNVLLIWGQYRRNPPIPSRNKGKKDKEQQKVLGASAEHLTKIKVELQSVSLDIKKTTKDLQMKVEAIQAPYRPPCLMTWEILLWMRFSMRRGMLKRKDYL
ncbi:hypothetical protein Pyn_08047 [Prunus yedoensis var. nudiflora]|uniref:Uncharacterized protein n=1 Tax=Prunus yedoensis var. nudiflora TaxID=2094558 RepID=A0A314UPG7_PRUYE|nr:hypothetical protein Pyn_14349 [Prunus yedoensis var. nudiflora]PQQ03483.1 hypothetical protein Pyn_08047 [Prunus yedoensis var. nudiflora]